MTTTRTCQCGDLTMGYLEPRFKFQDGVFHGITFCRSPIATGEPPEPPEEPMFKVEIDSFLNDEGQPRYNVRVTTRSRYAADLRPAKPWGGNDLTEEEAARRIRLARAWIAMRDERDRARLAGLNRLQDLDRHLQGGEPDTVTITVEEYERLKQQNAELAAAVRSSAPARKTCLTAPSAIPRESVTGYSPRSCPAPCPRTAAPALACTRRTAR